MYGNPPFAVGNVLIVQFNEIESFIFPCLHSLAAEQIYMTDDSASQSQLDESNWFINCARQKAEDMLMTRPDGTFLIRPKPEEGNHVLSIM